MFLVAEKAFLAINIACDIFHVITFWYLDQDSHPKFSVVGTPCNFKALLVVRNIWKAS